MLHSFPYVIQGDCTYKTSCYGLALLQIVGFNCKGKNFTVAYAFLQNEIENNYTWALNHLSNLFQENKLSIVIYIDRDYAFMLVVKKAFPESKHHLCQEASRS
ncbi:hypothetical protein LIER_05375 [Lithospermum erythrorhizon]|uniref:MULE transposase domain-containing protein n=1 Tax=Lithospermum erythrorhizon TaxID=34254 RepID=A0AAV3P186_LITER